MQGSNDLTKLTRWIVPGWIAILSYLIFIGLDVLFTPPGTESLSTKIFASIEELQGADAIISLVFLAAAGVPLGFSIYQVYFYIRWNSPFSRDGFLPPVIPGRMGDYQKILPLVRLSSLTGKSRWRRKWVEHGLFDRDHAYLSQYVELFYMDAVREVDSASTDPSFFSRDRFLHEVMHTLGASLLSIYLGFGLYLVTKNRIFPDDFHLADNLLIALLLVLTVFFLLNLENEARESVRISNIGKSLDRASDLVCAFQFKISDTAFQVIQPSAYYLFLLGVLHIAANPRIVDSNNSVSLNFLRYVVPFSIATIWIVAYRTRSVAARNGNTLMLLASLTIAFVLSYIPQFREWVNWAYFTSLFAFLLANLVIIKNRYNTKSQLFALKHYVIQKYLE